MNTYLKLFVCLLIIGGLTSCNTFSKSKRIDRKAQITVLQNDINNLEKELKPVCIPCGKTSVSMNACPITVVEATPIVEPVIMKKEVILDLKEDNINVEIDLPPANDSLQPLPEQIRLVQEEIEEILAKEDKVLSLKRNCLILVGLIIGLLASIYSQKKLAEKTQAKTTKLFAKPVYLKTVKKQKKSSKKQLKEKNKTWKKKSKKIKSSI